MKTYQPYCYFIKWSTTNVWYYGVEYSSTTKIANPENLWTSYFTSSKNVSEYRKRFGEPDIVKVTRVFKDAQSAIKWENQFLKRTKAKDNPASLNGHNSDGLTYKNKIVSEETKKKLSITRKKNHHWNNGTKNVFAPLPPDDTYVRGRLLPNNPGSILGGLANKNKKWYTNGKISIFVHPTDAPSGYVLGRIIGSHKNPDPNKKNRRWWNNGKEQTFNVVPPDSTYKLGRLRAITPP